MGDVSSGSSRGVSGALLIIVSSLLMMDALFQPAMLLRHVIFRKIVHATTQVLWSRGESDERGCDD